MHASLHCINIASSHIIVLVWSGAIPPTSVCGLETSNIAFIRNLAKFQKCILVNFGTLARFLLNCTTYYIWRPDSPRLCAYSLQQCVPMFCTPHTHNIDLAVFHRSGWSVEGCELLEASTSSVTCQCSHLTAFAVLLPQETFEVNNLTVEVYIFH